jgi:hypothetical protein
MLSPVVTPKFGPCFEWSDFVNGRLTKSRNASLFFLTRIIYSGEFFTVSAKVTSGYFLLKNRKNHIPKI